MEEIKILNTNSIAFIGLAQEYCVTVENSTQMERKEFISSILKLLPRLYISATDLTVNMLEEDDV